MPDQSSRWTWTAAAAQISVPRRGTQSLIGTRPHQVRCGWRLCPSLQIVGRCPRQLRLADWSPRVRKVCAQRECHLLWLLFDGTLALTQPAPWSAQGPGPGSRHYRETTLAGGGLAREFNEGRKPSWVDLSLSVPNTVRPQCV